MVVAEKRAALTIRIPEDMLALAKELKEDRESLNDLVIDAIDREVRRRQTSKIMAEVAELRERIFQRFGAHPDSTPMIRELREGVGRRD
jgi:hypothetical protein